MFDIIRPATPLEAFLPIARRLGLAGLVVLTKEPLPPSDFPLVRAVLGAGPASAVRLGPPDRSLLRQLDVLIDAEIQAPSDSFHQRKGGLNHVLVKEAAARGVAVAFNLGLLAGPKAALVMGRHAQNATLCRKAKCAVVPATFAATPWQLRSPHDIAAYLRVLGFTGNEAKAALTYFEGRVVRMH